MKKSIKEKKEISILQKYLDKKFLSVYAFCKIAGIHPATLYPIADGDRKPLRPLAMRICAATKGELKPSDFGFEI